VGIAGLAPGADFGEFVEYTGTGAITHLNDETGELWPRFGATGRSTFLFVNDDGTILDRTEYGDMDEERLTEEVERLKSS